MELVDRVDPVARRIGAINTIVVESDGTLTGYNNDGFGYLQSLRDAQADWRADAGPGAWCWAPAARARAIVASLIDAGARELRICNRTPARAEAIAQGDRRADHGRALGAAARRRSPMSRCSSTPPARACPGSRRWTSTSQRCRARRWCRMRSTSRCETPLLAAARARGNRTVNGLGMLLNQARPAFKAWFGVMPEITPELRRMIEATI